MYKIAHKRQQARAERVWLREMPPISEQLTPEQRRDVLVACVQRIDEMIARSRDPQYRKELGQQKFVFQLQLQELKKLRAQRGQDLGHFMLQILRERMSAIAWERVVKEARERFEAQESQPAAESDAPQ